MGDFTTDKQALLDLLVDGELGDDERRELLAWCQREPDGWRRCAVAFLEAQNWSKVLGELTDAARQPRRQVAAEAATRPAMPAVRQLVWNVRQWGTMLAMAASVLLAFMLGFWTREAGKAGRIVPRQAVVNAVGRGLEHVEQQPASDAPGRPEQGPEAARLVLGGQSRAGGEIDLPVIAGQQLDGDWLRGQPAAMPDEVRRALERLGHRVEQQRRLAPFRLDDGRRVYVPVDQVEVRPVENRDYQ